VTKLIILLLYYQ